MSKTLVLDINELYRVIPEAKSLEGRIFKDVRELLKDLIAKVEETGQWEFIQYVNNKPSLFIVREAPVSADSRQIERNLAKMQRMLEEMKTIPGAALIEAAPINVAPPAPDVYSNESFDEVAEVVSRMDVNVPSTPKLPWEK